MPRKSVVRITDRPDMTLDVYRGRKTTMQQQQQIQSRQEPQQLSRLSVDTLIQRSRVRDMLEAEILQP